MKMNAFISMLRGINVGGQKKIRMVELANLYESLGLVNVKTYVQSGNVVFNSTKSNASALANLIEAHIERLFGFSVSIFTRDTNDFQRIIEELIRDRVIFSFLSASNLFFDNYGFIKRIRFFRISPGRIRRP